MAVYSKKNKAENNEKLLTTLSMMAKAQKKEKAKKNEKLMTTFTNMAISKKQTKSKLINTFANMAVSQKAMNIKNAESLAAFKAIKQERNMIDHLFHFAMDNKVKSKKIMKTMYTMAVAGKRTDAHSKK